MRKSPYLIALGFCGSPQGGSETITIFGRSTSMGAVLFN